MSKERKIDRALARLHEMLSNKAYNYDVYLDVREVLKFASTLNTQYAQTAETLKIVESAAHAYLALDSADILEEGRAGTLPGLYEAADVLIIDIIARRNELLGAQIASDATDVQHAMAQYGQTLRSLGFEDADLNSFDSCRIAVLGIYAQNLLTLGISVQFLASCDTHKILALCNHFAKLRTMGLTVQEILDTDAQKICIVSSLLDCEGIKRILTLRSIMNMKIDKLYELYASIVAVGDSLDELLQGFVPLPKRPPLITATDLEIASLDFTRVDTPATLIGEDGGARDQETPYLDVNDDI